MTRRKIGIVGGLAALMLAPGLAALAQEAGPWLHVRVEEAKRQSRVSVNLPLPVVEAALQAAPSHVVENGRINLGTGDHKDLKVADLRRMWQELKATGDAEFVNVEEKDHKVRVARAGNLVLLRVEEPAGQETVRVEVPTEVVDALFSGEGSELNLKAALAELQKRRGDIVRVNDKGSTVRIWIDEKN